MDAAKRSKSSNLSKMNHVGLLVKGSVVTELMEMCALPFEGPHLRDNLVALRHPSGTKSWQNFWLNLQGPPPTG